MECEWHPGETAVLTCLQCGKQYCQICLTETKDTYYCPDCHREHVSDLASKLHVSGPSPKTRKEKRKDIPPEEPAIPGLLDQLEVPAPLTEPETPKEPAEPTMLVEPAPPKPLEPPPAPPEPPKKHMVAEELQKPEPPRAAEPEIAGAEPGQTGEPEKPGHVETGLPKTVVPAPESYRAVPTPGVSDKPAAPSAPGAVRGVTETAPTAAAREPQPVAPEIPKQQEPPAELLRGTRREEVPEVAAPAAPRGQQKRLRRPKEKPSGAPPPPSLSSEERAAFWGDIEKPRWKGRHAEAEAPLPGPPEREPQRPQPVSEPAPSSAAVPIKPEEIAEIAPQDEVAKVAPKAEPAEVAFKTEVIGPPPKAEPAEVTFKDEVAKVALEETAVSASATVEEKKLPPEGTTRVEEFEEVIPPDEVEVKDHFAPRLPKRGAHRREKPARRPAVVALQTPEDYDGEVTWDPTYLKAVLFGLLAGLLLAFAYAGFEWWRHSGRWILGWVIGFVVGIVVVFASGRHFNWRLGVISALITWFSLCIGQIVFSMLDVRFNSIFPLKLPFPTLLHQSLSDLWSTLGSLWLVLFIIAGLVAFLVSFRPWPVRFQISPPEDEGVPPKSSEPGKIAHPGVFE